MWGQHATCPRPSSQGRQAPHAYGSDVKAAVRSPFAGRLVPPTRTSAKGFIVVIGVIVGLGLMIRLS